MGGMVGPVTGAVILAGGRSTRMGADKATLDWHGVSLLRRTVEAVRAAGADPVVVAAAAGQALEGILPPGVQIERDRPGVGPLLGMAQGLAVLRERVDVAFVCATDLPLLHPRFVRAVVSELRSGVDVAVPVLGGRSHPLTAAYRTCLADEVAGAIATGERRVHAVVEKLAAVRLDEARLRADPGVAECDPLLESVLNVNSEQEYARARLRPPPRVEVRRAVGLAEELRGVHAWTLHAAVNLAGWPLDSAAVNGRVVPTQTPWPLFAGDVVALGPVQREDGGG
jgi:molybdopterin-guanine dinucleotide biosynthesis protein A